jgi:predicted DNA binding CopG/RHH family protein
MTTIALYSKRYIQVANSTKFTKENKMNTQIIKLTKEEQEIERNAENYKSVNGETLSKIEEIIKESAKKKNINIRISEGDLTKIKSRSLKDGIPYQTLISSILHKYLNGSLVDEAAVLYSIRMLNKAK